MPWNDPSICHPKEVTFSHFGSELGIARCTCCYVLSPPGQTLSSTPRAAPTAPQLSASPLLTPTPPAGSPGRGCLLPTVSLQSFQPEGYRETLGTRLRAEIIANIEFYLVKNMNFTMFPFSPPKNIYIHSTSSIPLEAPHGNTRVLGTRIFLSFWM